MSIKDMLNRDMKTALKAGEKERLSVIRMAKSAILYVEKEKLHDLNDDEVIEVLFREVKKRKNDIKEYERLGRMDIVEDLKKEVDILNTYLPQQLTEKEVEEIVRQTILDLEVTSLKDMGKIMGTIMPKVKGRADGHIISAAVKKLLK